MTEEIITRCEDCPHRKEDWCDFYGCDLPLSSKCYNW